MLKLKSSVSQFQSIILASSDTPNVGDHDGDMSETKVADCQKKNHKYHLEVYENNKPFGVECVFGEEG